MIRAALRILGFNFSSFAQELRMMGAVGFMIGEFGGPRVIFHHSKLTVYSILPLHFVLVNFS